MTFFSRLGWRSLTDWRVVGGWCSAFRDSVPIYNVGGKGCDVAAQQRWHPACKLGDLNRGNTRFVRSDGGAMVQRARGAVFCL